MIKRGRRYLPYIVSVFKQYRIPVDIAFALSFVESGFNPDARSGAGAVGMFQFMKSTARIYGLKVSGLTDEHKDYKKAAVTCVKYLRNNRNVFASTLLSLGSYHHGTGWVTRVLLSAADQKQRRSIFLMKCLKA